MDELNLLAEIWNVVEHSVNKYLWHQQMFNLAIKKNKGNVSVKVYEI